MPINKVKVHPKNAPWVTPNFAYLIKRRQKAFKDYRNLVNQERKKLRGNYFSCKVENLKEALSTTMHCALFVYVGCHFPGREIRDKLHVF